MNLQPPVHPDHHPPPDDLDDLDELPPSPFGPAAVPDDMRVDDSHWFGPSDIVDLDELPRRGGDIYAAMARVMARIEPIEKRQVDAGPGGRFKAKTIDDVFFAVRAAMAAEGVFVVQRVVGHTQDTRTTSGNKVVFRDDYDVEVWFVARDGSRIMTGPWPGRGEDLMDKSPTKGLSYAIKAALIGTFLIVGGVTEPDENAPGESTAAEQRPAWAAGWDSTEQYREQRDELAARVRSLPEPFRADTRDKINARLEAAGVTWNELPLNVYLDLAGLVTRAETAAQAAMAEPDQAEPADGAESE